MKKWTLAAAVALTAAMLIPAAGCANISLFSSQHEHYHADPNESGKIDAMNKRIDRLENENAHLKQEAKR